MLRIKLLPLVIPLITKISFCEDKKVCYKPSCYLSYLFSTPTVEEEIEVPKEKIEVTKIDSSNIIEKELNILSDIKDKTEASNIIEKELNLQENLLKEIKKNPLSLEFVKNKTQELCDLAVYNNIVAFLYVPSEFMTNEMLEYVIKKNPFLLEIIPENKQTSNLCELAMDLNIKSYEYVCDKLRTENYYVRCIKTNFANELCPQTFLGKIPDSKKTEKICYYLALRGYFEYVPENLRTYELCKIGLKKSGINASIKENYIPKKYLPFIEYDKIMKKYTLP
uniref:DUF4116 domain-containing protein n=1 Tax=viral metagenome TaxID=1070528 RepID=A0A6C0ADF4_9ZZZZ